VSPLGRIREKRGAEEDGRRIWCEEMTESGRREGRRAELFHVVTMDCFGFPSRFLCFRASASQKRKSDRDGLELSLRLFSKIVSKIASILIRSLILVFCMFVLIVESMACLLSPPFHPIPIPTALSTMA
jgi:hypothetical protein